MDVKYKDDDQHHRRLQEVELEEKEEVQQITGEDILNHDDDLAGVEVSNYMNNQYYAILLFGSQKQPMNLLIDTGSSLTWVPSMRCSRKECPGNVYMD